MIMMRRELECVPSAERGLRRLGWLRQVLAGFGIGGDKRRLPRPDLLSPHMLRDLGIARETGDRR